MRPGLATEHVPDASIDKALDRTEHVPDLPRFGRFRATAELGTGAMGTVYRAHDDVLGRAVAIKALRSTNGMGVRERFVHEARAIGGVHHPNIVGIFDAGTEGDTPYLVMELAAGGTLRDRIKAGRLPVDEVRSVGIQIARALAAAHAANIVHRDVKPANILCTADGVWKLADFGIAHVPDSTLTITGQFLGSPSYAAPESLRGGEFSPASDVYGLAATLYEALSGATPHGDHGMQSLVRKLEHDPMPLHERVPVPGPIGNTIMAALARDPKQRPRAEDFAAMLADGASAAPVAPVAAPSRHRALVIAALVGLALVVMYVATHRSASPGVAVPDSAEAPQAPELGSASDPASEPATQPTFIDENGNPVDEATARRILDQLQRDSVGPGRGRGHRKHKGRD